MQENVILNTPLLYNEDCITAMEKLINSPMKGAVDAIVVDLPYYGVVKDNFDNQWLTVGEYLDWVLEVFAKASYLIKKNGNIIVFCSR